MELAFVKVGPKVRGSRFHLGVAHAKIYKVDGEYRVTTPAEVNGREKEFRILNMTSEPARVTLSEDIVGRGAGLITVPGEGMITIPIAKGAWGVRSYSVAMDTLGGFVTAHGNSDPVIIIDPPAN
ncbi:MAG: hypothetical protein MUE61_01085 [Vicinamibacterales bacterium]|jgi:hypothetical protein|nr:hypothetical protein [Vicinamibacterales bacterium]